MRNKKIKIISYLAIIIVGLGILIQQRKFNITNHLYETYSQLYLKIKKPNVIVSLTTTPDRIDSIEKVIVSIENQSYKANKIYLNVPHKLLRNDKTYQIPSWTKNHPTLVVNRCKDYGPATKLLGTLKKNLSKNTIIVTIDDDFLYPNNLIINLVTRAIQTDSTVALSGGNFRIEGNRHKVENFMLDIMPDNSNMYHLHGYGGVAYHYKHLKEDLFSINRDMQECFLSDDIVFSFYMLKHGIKIKHLSNDFINAFDLIQLPSSKNADALSMGALGKIEPGHFQQYVKCMKGLRKKYPDVKYPPGFITQGMCCS